jgi:hypothetical protein
VALVVGDMVYLAVNGGLMTRSPLFGVVDYINGDPPDIVRVCWSNGATQFFSSVDESLNRLVVFMDLSPTQQNVRQFGHGELRRLSTTGGVISLIRHASGVYELKGAES